MITYYKNWRYNRMTIEDLKDLQEDFTIETNKNNVILYHATTEENAKQIINSQSMYGKENGLFFSNIPNGEIIGYGNAIVKVEIPINKIELDDQFSEELHFRMECKPNTFYHVNATLYR
jgi:uncharacterized protein (UPF0333 family)